MAPDSESAAAFVRAYYDALEGGDPLGPFFADGPGVVKFGLSERLEGGEAVAAGLSDQTRRTRDWAVESRDLTVTERDGHAWFADRVSMGWTDAERGIRFEFDTRWSGAMERTDVTTDRPPWLFVGMHVSTAEAL